MLKSLNIQNYAIIDDLTIDFNSGFNVFTGETGAGKSIIIGALSFLSNKRSDTSVIQTGKDKAIIEGVFSIEDNDIDIKEKLKDNLIDYDNELIVKRVISKDGNNSIRVNGSTVTLSFLENLLKPLIDIHSQNDNQYLFQKKNHLSLLDKYSCNHDLLNEYKVLYDKYTKSKQEYDSLLNETYSESDLEFINYQLEELEKAELDSSEEEDLLEKERNYKLAEKYINNLSGALDLYNDSLGIKERMQSVLKELDIKDDRILEERSAIENLYYELDERINNIEKIYSSFDGANINIEKLEERLFVYSKLKRKYNKSTSELIEFIDELKQKVNLYKDKDVILLNKKKEVETLYNDAYKCAEKLSKVRKENSLKLSKAIDKEASDLMLNNVNFCIVIEDIELNKNGIDDVEFYISLNKGEDPKPLKSVASGGEISRIMLALKIIFTKLSDTKLIVFDEIDSGVSGKAALSIGQKMALISNNTQVITITHLAPVASCAKYHYYIFKETNDNVTRTNVKLLNLEQTYQELALMSNGSINKQSVEAAKTLFKKSQEMIYDN